MENYELDEDEVVLYKGNVTLPNNKGLTDLILTNKNFVLITKEKKLFAKEQVDVDIYPAFEIKEYKGTYQVLQKGNKVELYFLHDETEFEFEAKSEARKFVNAALTLLTDKTAFERAVDKAKAKVSMVDNSLGINSAEVVKNFATSGKLGKTVGVVGKGAKAIGKLMHHK